MNQAKRDTSHDSALVETVDLSKGIGHAKVHRAFLDPLGAHLVLSLKPTDPEAQPDLLYLNREVCHVNHLPLSLRIALQRSNDNADMAKINLTSLQEVFET